MKLKSKTTTAIIFAAFALAVWSSPAASLFNSGHEPVSSFRLIPWIHVNLPVAYNGQPSGLLYPIGSSHVYNRRNYIPKTYSFPFGVQHQSTNFLHPMVSGIRHDWKDTSGVQNEKHIRRTVSEDVIMPSFDSIPRHASFTDKSFLSFFSKVVMPVRFVNRISTFPNIRVTYKNITLTGLAIG
ncbi:uncharacterized protein LOC130700664 [Daphnia carinata]|uniref:uncharacterized protein LOC130700664 n=1 Tax=Daphnia carinata TaxID=120202 RepID=UPI00257CABFC|nr:uncharacterized protein LOC130700664 [Daphnia carinata]